MKIERYLKEAKNSQKEEFQDIARKSLEVLRQDKKIIFLPREGKLIVIGDLHGSPEGIKAALKNGNPEKDYFLFLGDYGDRGRNSPELYFILLKLKVNFPKKILLLRGNHEPTPYLIPYPHEIPSQLKKKYESAEPYLILKEIWEELPMAAVLREKYLFLHGGLPIGLKSIKDLQKRENLEEILWNDPVEGIRGAFLSPRGAGRVFGENITKKILKKIKIKTLIRSHQVCEGINIHHNGKILTLFSTNTFPYKNKKRAILKIDLKKKAQNAFSLPKKAIFF